MQLAKRLPFFLVGLLAFAQIPTATAQVSSPLRILNGGTQLPPQYKLNFVNGGCANNAAQQQIDCTVSVASSVSVNSPITGDGTVGNPLSCATCAVTTTDILFSVPDYASSGVVSVSTAAGSFTTGQRFYLYKAATISGARFFYPHGGTARTIKVSLWDNTGTRVATVNVAVSASGIYTATFNSSIAYSAFQQWIVSIWENSGTEYYFIPNSQNPCYPGFCPTQISSYQPTPWGLHEMMVNPRDFGNGDTVPNSAATTSETYLVEPVYTIP